MMLKLFLLNQTSKYFDIFIKLDSSLLKLIGIDDLLV